MASGLPKKEYKTRKDLDILFAWLLFYRQNNKPMEYKKCQEQIEELDAKLKSRALK
jgi:hypothetical protein